MKVKSMGSTTRLDLLVSAAALALIPGRTLTSESERLNAFRPRAVSDPDRRFATPAEVGSLADAAGQLALGDRSWP